MVTKTLFLTLLAVLSASAAKDTTLSLNSVTLRSYIEEVSPKQYDLNSILPRAESGPALTDLQALLVLWPDTAESFRLDTANHKTYVLNYFPISDSVSGLAVFYQGGCLELWIHTIRNKRRVDRFLASETCASDAEDYSNGLFLSPTLFENTKTWMQEYTEEGEDANRERITHFAIGPDGTIREKIIREQ